MRQTVRQYIRKCSLQKIWYPLGLVILLLILFWQLPIYRQVVHPAKIAGSAPHSFSSYYEDDVDYLIETDVENLYYTGYDYTVSGSLKGHYYYRLDTDSSHLYFYILPAETGKPAQSPISKDQLKGKLIQSDQTSELLCTYLATDLTWDRSQIDAMADPIIFSAVDYLTIPQIIVYSIYVICLALALFATIRHLLYILMPTAAPVYRRLAKYGRPADIVADVDAQLKDECLVLTKDMALLQDYLIEFSEDISVIVPLKHILWLYEHATLRQSSSFRPLEFTLHIVMENGDTFLFNKKQKQDIDIILEELSARYPNFFYGYSDEHYQLVHHILEDQKKTGHRKKKPSKTNS